MAQRLTAPCALRDGDKAAAHELSRDDGQRSEAVSASDAAGPSSSSSPPLSFPSQQSPAAMDDDRNSPPSPGQQKSSAAVLTTMSGRKRQAGEGEENEHAAAGDSTAAAATAAGSIHPAEAAEASDPSAFSAATSSAGMEIDCLPSGCSPLLLERAPLTAAQPAQAPFTAAASSSSSSLAQPPPPMTMLRCLAACRDVQFVLMQLLELEDLAALDSTCHQWLQWLPHPPLVDGLQFHREGTWRQLLSLAQCDWACRLVTSIVTWLEEDIHGWWLVLNKPDDSAAKTACVHLLALLSHFTRLRHLDISLCDTFVAFQPDWPTCYTALSAGLRCLELFSHGHRLTDQVNSALAQVALLQRLEELKIFVYVPSHARELDLSQLPLLPRLRTFQLKHSNEENFAPFEFRCTLTQARCLAQCRQLTHLKYGSWSPDRREVDDGGWQLRAAEKQIAEGIATLVSGLTSGGESFADSSSSSAAAAAPMPTHCALQHLDLNCTIIFAAVWEHLSRVTSLTNLVPVCWHDLSPQQWARLADFTQLQSILIRLFPEDDYSNTPLRTDHFLPSLLRCTQLISISLNGSTLSLSFAQLHGLARLPLLQQLELHVVELASAAPLTAAQRLNRLGLFFCRGSPLVVDFRSSLLSLPALTSLGLEDRCRITAEQATPLNAALFARMPKLTPEHFTQNLLAQ